MGTKSETILANPERARDGTSWIYAHETGFRPYAFNLPRRALFVEFINVVIDKLITTGGGLQYLGPMITTSLEAARVSLTIPNPIEIQNPVDDTLFDGPLLHPVLNLNSIVLPTFKALGTSIKAVIRFVIPPHLLLLGRMRQLYFHQADFLSRGYFASAEAQKVFAEITKLWNTALNSTAGAPLVPTSWYKQFSAAHSTVEKAYCDSKNPDAMLGPLGVPEGVSPATLPGENPGCFNMSDVLEAFTIAWQEDHNITHPDYVGQIYKYNVTHPEDVGASKRPRVLLDPTGEFIGTGTGWLIHIGPVSDRCQTSVMPDAQSMSQCE